MSLSEEEKAHINILGRISPAAMWSYVIKKVESVAIEAAEKRRKELEEEEAFKKRWKYVTYFDVFYPTEQVAEYLNKSYENFNKEKENKQWGQKGDKMFNFELKDGLLVKFTKWGSAREGILRTDQDGTHIISDLSANMYSPEEVHDLRPAEGFYPVMGDVLVCGNGYKRKVLGVVGCLYSLSNDSDFNLHYGWCTREELIKESYKIKGQIETITHEEAEKRLGVRIEVKK